MPDSSVPLIRARLAIRICVALLSVVGITSAEPAGASFTSLVGTQASYCLVSAQENIDPEPCVVEQFSLWDCSVSTVPTCTTPNPYAERTAVEAWWQPVDDPTTRRIIATSSYVFEGDIGISISLSLNGTRVDSTLFTISGSHQFSSCVANGSCEHVEIALIRYAGDPAAFEGLAPETVHDLVAAGLIDDSDILFVQTEFSDFPNPSLTPFDVSLPVNGIRDDQIYLFSTLQTPLPEPAGATALLAGAMTIVGLAARRSRRGRAGGKRKARDARGNEVSGVDRRSNRESFAPHRSR